ncbi:MAG: YtxH domain-containing protein [Anaerolineaceae bacterium]|jgi:gas vesicle protein
MSDSKDFGAFIMGFTVGVLAGAVTSLLLAPQTGEETRQYIKEKAIELKEKGTDSFEETKKKAEVAYKEALSKAAEVGDVTLEKATTTAQKTAEKVEEKIDKAAKTIDPKPAKS